ncbi:hypothetical protein AC579_9001 [Pseudocercospora musae]|uniref:Uncharacterized protein n=1 Tax=Pseudocercospora musae TaxID=113226 RepID=A0A139H6L6_9PEZI|nr:hypothetical protein AC579_9001 [Pseudocercospora musae]
MPSRSAVYSSIATQAPRPFFGPPRPRPRVVLLQLQKESFFDDQYARLLQVLKAKAEVDTITSRSAASALFNSKYRPVVLATDQALTESKNSTLGEEARQFVRSGGTLIFCCHFPTYSQPSDVDELFSRFDLPWECGDYHRTEHSINDYMAHVETTGLTSHYSQKALHLQNVDRSDAVYLPSNTSHIESSVFPLSPIEDLSQTPAAFAACGRGKVGFLGDLNAEDATHNVVLAMCGLR